MNCAPALIFFSRRNASWVGLGSFGDPAAPRKRAGGSTSFRPSRNLSSSRSLRRIHNSWVASRSKGKPWKGTFPAVGVSPVRQSTLWTPRALAPSTSDCRFSRLWSLAVICRMGSIPMSTRSRQQARLDMRAVDIGFVAMFTAWTRCLMRPAFSANLPVLAPAGGTISVVTTNSPFLSAVCRLETGSTIPGRWYSSSPFHHCG